MEHNNAIFFWGVNHEFGWLSNFYKSDFVDSDNNKYNCNEKYFMAHKCLTFAPENKLILDQIMAQTDPLRIKNFGRKIPNFNEEIWTTVKYNIMVDGLRLKFSQNENLKNKLMLTKDKMLYEASPYDSIWGIGLTGYKAMNLQPNSYRGQNLLGLALMEVRSELK